VKEDINSLNARINESRAILNKLEKRLVNTTAKDEFYDFIRELNEELRKLEKNIATQSSLERLRASFNTQLRELGDEIKARREINRKLKRLPGLEKKIRELKGKILVLDGLKKKLTEIEKNYVNWAEFFKKLKEINDEERFEEFRRMRDEFGHRLDTFEDRLSDYVSKKELKRESSKLRKLINEQAAIINEQWEEIDSLRGKRRVKPRIKGKPGLIERGLNWLSTQFSSKEYLFPLLVLIVIAVLLTIGIIFFREDIFSPELYMDAQDIECRNQFECKELENGTFLTGCRFDELLDGCHCNATSGEQCVSD